MADWRTFLLHALFSGYPAGYAFFRLTYAVLQPGFFADPDMHPADFSLFAPEAEEGQGGDADENDVLMQKAAGLAGGVRFGEEGRRL
ncbi:phage tail assembly protein T [Escherichia coli]|uniref:phage tail assembly protein T n=1 Tax=Escherichia coli TaxID=562 RepID=UPI00397ECBA5